MENQNTPISNTPTQPTKNWFLRHEFLYSVIGGLLLIVIVGSMALWKQLRNESLLLGLSGCDMYANGKPICNDISKPQNETATWKTYTNSEYGFEFKYPKGVYLVESQGGARLQNFSPDEDRYKFNSNEFSIEAAWITRAFSDSDLDSISNSKQGNLNGYKIYEGDETSSHYPAHNIYILSPKGDFVVLLAIGNFVSAKANYIDPILSTFKFIN